NWVPEPGFAEEIRASVSDKYSGSAGWGDAAVQVPYHQWWCYGDTRILQDQWDSMQKWLAFAAERAATTRHASKDGTPQRPHEKFIWDGGFHWSDWLEPDVTMEMIMAVFNREVDQGAVATAYLYRSANQMAEIAKILGTDGS